MGKKEKGKNENSRFKIDLKKETKNSIYAIISFTLSIFFIIISAGKGGLIGESLYNIFKNLFGWGYFLLPIVLILLGVSFIKAKDLNMGLKHTVSSLLLLFSILGLIDIISADSHLGGILGKATASLFLKLFDKYASVLFLGAAMIISALMLFDAKINGAYLIEKFKNIFKKNSKAKSEKARIEYVRPPETENTSEISKASEVSKINKTSEVSKISKISKASEVSKVSKTSKDEEEEFIKKPVRNTAGYVFPPLSLLEKDQGKPEVGDIKANTNIIKRTLQNFGIDVEMDEVVTGPTVTRYSMRPAEGVRLSRILALQNELALALAAHPIRIEAPIPGKSLVGIEVPNRARTMVRLGSLLTDDKFANVDKPLLISLGKNVTGKCFFASIAKLPHLLIAGATGAGKSVTIHSLIISLLYKHSPDELKFVFIDPKRVELTLYNALPHLLTPVITEPKKAIFALKWAIKEMERRYTVLEEKSVRDVASYHANVLAKDPDADPMPYIVIMIDELADIMSTYPRELEGAIVRLAQMSRAVGIHLVLSTQRPEVKVITGLIKANIPARIALQVASQVDSRTIIDMAGAEKLLGAGDMLWISGDMAQPERLQSPYLSEEELKKVANFIIKNNKDHVVDAILGTPINGGETARQTGPSSETGQPVTFPVEIDMENFGEDGDDGALYEEAKKIVMEAGKASTSYLQRRLKIGYARAARIMDMLEERGVVSKGEGAKPREVINGSGSETNAPSSAQEQNYVEESEDEEDGEELKADEEEQDK